MKQTKKQGNGNQVAGTQTEEMKSVLDAVVNAKSEVINFFIHAEENEQYSLYIQLDRKHVLKVEYFNGYRDVSYDLIGENGQVMLSTSGDYANSENAYHTLVGMLYMMTI